MPTENNKLMTTDGPSHIRENHGTSEHYGDEHQDEENWTPFFDYLKSENGHQIASRILGLIEDVKKATLDKNYSHAKFNRVMEASVIVAVIVVVAWLSIIDKLNPTVGVLLGSVVGYFFGKDKSR